ncbi:MAG TPA: 2-amino-4-hydroxy-6-hydroxymethyldihydropteridine diphosphokinase [Bacteroidota bacterium]|nr:2-amino-4-hydroxy-6-hydroxymethyldihydropteridine diphosphokinase [Bacteroidota bacterium]
MIFRTYLGLGSNIGDRGAYLKRAIDEISSFASILKCSSVYETEPVEMQSDSAFYNMAIEVATEIESFDLLPKLKEIEYRSGRKLGTHLQPREIDIDILFCEGIVYKDDNLEIPHPKLASRRFALEPLSEIAGSLTFPPTLVTIREMLERCPDRHRVIKLGPLTRTTEISKQQ